MLNYNIKGSGLEISDEMRAYAEKTLTHAEKFLSDDPTTHADIELEHSPLRDGGKYRAEFTISAGGALYRAESWGSTLHEAIDLVTADLAKELRRAKDKRTHIFRRGALRVKEYVRGFRDRF